MDALKLKYEGSTQDLTGTLTGFTAEGVFDSLGYNQWWSASVDMTGRTASQSSQNNPNTRWANPAPVLKDDEDVGMIWITRCAASSSSAITPPVRNLPPMKVF